MSKKSLPGLITILLILVVSVIIPGPFTSEEAVFHAYPEEIDPDGHYLIYLHGRIIETEGIDPVSPQFINSLPD